MPSIGREEKLKIRKAVLRHFADSQKATPVLEYLFERAIDGPEGKVSEYDLINVKGAPKTDNAIRNLVSRLRKSLEIFFAQNAVGRSQLHKAVLPKRGYVLSFVPNTVPPPDASRTAFFDQFWLPFTGSKHPIQILYSEPQFYRDGQQMSLHIDDGDSPNDRLAGKLTSVHGFVPTGVMQALLRLLQEFGRAGTPAEYGSLRSIHDMPEPDQDIIILATPGIPRRTVARLEVTLSVPLFPTDGAASRSPRNQQAGSVDSAVSHEAVVLTRRPHRINGRTLMILSARHAGAIDALARSLTRDSEIAPIAEALKCGTTFPEYFQAVFSVPTLSSDPESFIGPLRLESAVSLEPYARRKIANLESQQK